MAPDIESGAGELVEPALDDLDAPRFDRRAVGRRADEADRLADLFERRDAGVPGGGTVRDLAAEVLEIASAGLTERAELNAAGDNEGGFLDPLRDVVASGKTFADRLLDRYHGEWNGDVSHVYDEYSF